MSVADKLDSASALTELIRDMVARGHRPSDITAAIESYEAYVRDDARDLICRWLESRAAHHQLAVELLEKLPDLAQTHKSIAHTYHSAATDLREAKEP